jgi:flavin reductase (DIM6/NTAB) family NADH-FMN oxidoreductase RutF
VQVKVLLHSSAPLIAHMSDKETQWIASLFPRSQSMPDKFQKLNTSTHEIDEAAQE